MIKKFYLTRTHTRAMALDHPIGDPTGGAAYGEKNDPISAIISIASMAGTYYTAGSFAAMTLMQGITFAGAALSLVGNVTGNKTLSKIGMIAGLAGGVGMFADKMLETTMGGTLGEIYDSAGRAVGGSNVDISEVFKPAPGSLAPVVDGVQNVGTNALDVDMSAATNSAAAPNVNTLVNTNTAGVDGVVTPAAAGEALTTAPARSLSASVKPGIDPFTAQTETGLRTLPGDSAAVTKPGFMDSLKTGNFGDAASAAGTNAMDMLKNNPTGAYVAAKAVGAAADWLSGKTDAELDALKANTGYATAKALEVQTALDREKMRRANLNSGYTNVDAGFKVNPNAAVAQPYQQPPGLVAGAMQPRQG